MPLPTVKTYNLATSQVGSAIVLAATSNAMKPGENSGVTMPQNLRNPLAYPVLVDEILFSLNYTGVGDANNGGDVRVGLRLGTEDIIRAYTPLGVLGKARNQSAGTVPPNTLTVSGNIAGFLLAQENVGLYSCRFSSPLIMYPGEQLEPIFYNAGILDTSNSYTARVLVKGRVLPKDAVRTSYPWINFFAGAKRTNNSVVQTEVSKESDLNNPFSTPLFVERLIGMLCSVDTNVAQGFGMYSNGSAVDAGLQNWLIRMSDHAGRPIIRDNTPFGHVFQMQDWAWEMRATMPPNGFWYTYFTENCSLIPVTANIQAFIGLIGHRRAS